MSHWSSRTAARCVAREHWRQLHAPSCTPTVRPCRCGAVAGRVAGRHGAGQLSTYSEHERADLSAPPFVLCSSRLAISYTGVATNRARLRLRTCERRCALSAARHTIGAAAGPTAALWNKERRKRRRTSGGTRQRRMGEAHVHCVPGRERTSERSCLRAETSSIDTASYTLRRKPARPTR